MRVLVLGVTGMLGNAVWRLLSEAEGIEVWGSMRNAGARQFFREEHRRNLIAGIDVLNHDTLVRLLERVRPDVVINCIGLIKQLSSADDPLVALPINAMLPHRLERICSLIGARLIHVSTDCVFSGRKGDYRENDTPDAEDLYGKSKYIGEVGGEHTITFRTSIIGHELNSSHALIEWFLAQTDTVHGYRRAIFSGLPTVEMARIIRDVILTRPELFGVYHISAEPISKYELLKLVSVSYGKDIEIVPDDSVVVDRSLNSERFQRATGYVAPSWETLVKRMSKFK